MQTKMPMLQLADQIQSTVTIYLASRPLFAVLPNGKLDMGRKQQGLGDLLSHLISHRCVS